MLTTWAWGGICVCRCACFCCKYHVDGSPGSLTSVGGLVMMGCLHEWKCKECFFFIIMVAHFPSFFRLSYLGTSSNLPSCNALATPPVIMLMKAVLCICSARQQCKKRRIETTKEPHAFCTMLTGKNGATGSRQIHKARVDSEVRHEPRYRAENVSVRRRYLRIFKWGNMHILCREIAHCYANEPCSKTLSVYCTV